MARPSARAGAARGLVGGWPWGPPELLALLAALYVAGLRYQRAVLWWMWALTLIPWSLWLHAEVADLNGPVTATILFTAAVMAADSLGLRLRAERDLAVQTGQTEAERAQRAVLEERARIARELHDVVAHHMSLIAIQAETAPYRLADMPEAVCEEFSSLSATAREALSDMRRLLGVLRQDQPASLAPQPQLGDIPLLVDAARRAGVAIRLSAPAAFAPVPSGVGICLPNRAGVAVQRKPARSGGCGHRVDLSSRRNAPRPCFQWTRHRRSGAWAGARTRPRPGRDARARGTARGLVLGRPGRERLLRCVRGYPARRHDVTTRCLIVDDQAMVREGFAAVLAAQPGLTVVGQAADGAEAVRQAGRLRPDVVLMDVRMPVLDGLAATRQILRDATADAGPRVLMLTTFDLDDYVYEALRAGASGFLLKDATAAELVHAVRVVAAGDALLAPSVTRRLIADFARRPRASSPRPVALEALTQRETEVLRLIASGLSNAEISDALVIAMQTTKTYVGRILAKLGLRDRAQAVVLAYESGLVTPGYSEPG